MIFVRKILKRATYDTPLGRMRAVGDGEVLYELSFCKENFLEENDPSSLFLEVGEWLRAYFSYATLPPMPMLKPEGSPFQKKVWEAALTLGVGESRSYQEIGRMVGSPKGSQAVGQALGRNPILLMIPCHRVVRADGSLGGFSSGLERKRWLLGHEGFRF